MTSMEHIMRYNGESLSAGVECSDTHTPYLPYVTHKLTLLHAHTPHAHSYMHTLHMHTLHMHTLHMHTHHTHTPRIIPDYLHDPYSEGNPMKSICSRGDLQTKPSPGGCIDTKVTADDYRGWALYRVVFVQCDRLCRGTMM